MTKPVEDYAAKTIMYKGKSMSLWLWLSQPYFIKRLQWNRSEHWNGKFYWKWYEMINPFCTYQDIQAKIKAQKIVIKPVEKKKPTIIYPADQYIKVAKKAMDKPVVHHNAYWEGLKYTKPKPKVMKFKGR